MTFTVNDYHKIWRIQNVRFQLCS